MSDFFKRLTFLIWPLFCAGCGKYDVALCAKCRKIKYLFGRNIAYKIPVFHGQDRCIFAYTYYGSPTKHIILNWKNNKREDLDTLFFNSLSRLVRDSFCDEEMRKLMAFHMRKDSEVVIVPAPSGRKAINRRGRLHTSVLCKAVKSEFENYFSHVKIRQLLKQTRKTKKQITLNEHERLKNKYDNVLPKKRAKKYGAKEKGDMLFILVDDIITTGGTLKACADKLEKLNINVPIIYVFASTEKTKREK